MEINYLLDTMLSKKDETQIAGLSRFFKTGKGQYGEGDKFLGIKVPVTREVVKNCWKNVTLDNIDECIRNEYHEVRLAGLLALVQKYKHERKNRDLQKEYVDYYLSRTEYINNWDLVDLSCYEILGNWILTNPKEIIYDLSRNGKTIWEQRIGIVTTMALIRKGDLDDIYNIAEIFLEKGTSLHDLLQKAVGWLLREAGKRDENRLIQWLNPRYKTMPRTMLRYSIEKIPEQLRQKYMIR